MSSITESYHADVIPLYPVPFPYPSQFNNANTSVWSGGAGDQANGWLYHAKTNTTYGLPSAANIGITISGQQWYPMFNNIAEYTPEHCEVDACNSHVGQGGGQPHLHGDPFGPSCLYTAANYSSLDAHPPVVGFALDGYWIYGRYLSTAAPGYATALDDCGGHNHSITVAGVTAAVYQCASARAGGPAAWARALSPPRPPPPAPQLPHGRHLRYVAGKPERRPCGRRLPRAVDGRAQV